MVDKPVYTLAGVVSEHGPSMKELLAAKRSMAAALGTPYSMGHWDKHFHLGFGAILTFSCVLLVGLGWGICLGIVLTLLILQRTPTWCEKARAGFAVPGRGGRLVFMTRHALDFEAFSRALAAADLDLANRFVKFLQIGSSNPKSLPSEMICEFWLTALRRIEASQDHNFIEGLKTTKENVR